MNEKLLNYIRQELSKGITKEKIGNSLVAAGWKTEDIINAFIYLGPQQSGDSKTERLSSFLIRIGLAFVFLYAAVFMTISPEKYIDYFPKFMRDLVPGYTLLHIFAIFEVIHSFFLIIGKFKFINAIISFLTMLSLTVVNLDKFSVLFRNVSIILSALALVIQSRKTK
jgi:uncharacterized membrane protein YphA (DoxX/SURF4 family)